MGSFVSFSDMLPDPVYTVGRAGQPYVDSVTDPEQQGAGFKQATLTSEDSFLNTTTSAGSRYTTDAYFHKWQINITYNKLTRAEFDPVYTFLINRKTTMQPFYVALPQYMSQTVTGVTLSGIHTKRDPVILVSTAEHISPNQIFRIGTNPKIFMISRSESETDHNLLIGSPGVGKERLHITPGLVASYTSPEPLDFATPFFRVQQVGEIIEYSIDSTNLYKFSLKVEEV